MVSEGKARLFKNSQGRYLIYLPVDLAQDSMFPFKVSDSMYIKVGFKHGDDKHNNLGLKRRSQQHNRFRKSLEMKV